MKPDYDPATALTALAGIVIAITVTVVSAALFIAGPGKSDEPSAEATTMAAVWREPPSRPFVPTAAPR